MYVSNELIWQKLEKLDNKISGDSGLAALNSKVEALNTRIAGVETRLAKVESSLDKKLDSSAFYWFSRILITVLIAAFAGLSGWMYFLHQ